MWPDHRIISLQHHAACRPPLALWSSGDYGWTYGGLIIPPDVDLRFSKAPLLITNRKFTRRAEGERGLARQCFSSPLTPENTTWPQLGQCATWSQIVMREVIGGHLWPALLQEYEEFL